MAKTLPYFNFTPQDWQNGDIGIEDYAVKGMFIDVCCFYWLRCCSVTRIMLDKKFSNDTARIDYLISIGIIKENKDNGTISITFLDKHLKETTGKIEARREAGRIGGLAKASNAKNLLLAKASNKNREDKNREDDSKKTKAKKADDLPEPEPKVKTSKRFIKPTSQQVTEYAKTINFDLEGERFIDSYESKGWMIGKNQMKDWKSAVRTWKRMDNDRKNPKERPLHPNAQRGIERFCSEDEGEVIL